MYLLDESGKSHILLGESVECPVADLH